VDEMLLGLANEVVIAGHLLYFQEIADKEIRKEAIKKGLAS